MHKASCLALACSVVLGFGAARVDAATIPVAAGEVIVDPGNGRCSLREAINNANAGSDTSGGDCVPGDAGTNDIILAAGATYNLPDVAASSVEYGQSGLPAITSTIDIKGNQATIQRSATLFSGSDRCNSLVSDNFRIFFVDTTGVLTLENVRLHNGCASFEDDTGAGGAIFNRGSVTLQQCTVSDNTARQSGGGIHNDGTLELIQTTVSNNLVFEGAGGGIVNTAMFTAKQSTINGNAASGDGDPAGAGGAMYNQGGVVMGNSTISGNQADGTGGGLQNESIAALTNVTITQNTATKIAASPEPGFGGGIFLNSGTVTLANTIVAKQLRGTDCFGTIASNGHNLDSDGTCVQAVTDMTSATPELGPLANNGGPTETHALLFGSPAIDHGDNTICAAEPVNDMDQRGVTRPLNGGMGLICDIGAFEFCLSCQSNAPAASATTLVGLACLLLAVGAAGVRCLGERG
jgi:hypothetical protein